MMFFSWYLVEFLCFVVDLFNSGWGRWNFLECINYVFLEGDVKVFVYERVEYVISYV